MNLKHFALYSKGWYKRSDNIWNDLKIILEADNYTPFTKSDILDIIIRNCAPLFKYNIVDYTIQLVSAIHPAECWKCGYYTKDHKWINDKDAILPDYDYQTAILYYFKSRVSNSTIDELGGLPEADANVLPLHIEEKTK